MLNSSQQIWCAKSLIDSGFFQPDIAEKVASAIKDYEIDEYQLVAVKHDFFTELAEKLRKLWPEGEKDGKYPWRGSVKELSARLETLWNVRNLPEYTIDECLSAARRYLSQFQDNAKYMKILKYFILKQDKLVQTGGKIRYVWQSSFADMLDSNPLKSTWDEFDDNATSTFNQGELI